jgi:hypothetical protein
MLKLSVAAGVPLIAISTRDVLNLPSVVEAITGKTPVRLDPENPQAGLLKDAKQKLFYIVPLRRLEYPWEDIYRKLLDLAASTLVVNPHHVVEPMFNAGEVMVPQKLTLSLMKNVISDEKRAMALVQVLGGCTIKETAELVRLTMARDASLTPRGVMQTRKAIFTPGKGLTPIDPTQAYYGAPLPLQAWVERERPFFLNASDPRLTPRGLLFDGPPGTGKTAGAKWIAAQLGVPLFRVDVAGTKGRFVGDSETAMATNLARVDAEEPCVALIDEVEKIFGHDHYDGGTTASMLSQLLWWLAEHPSRVLTVMTTNNSKILPRELYREGRIDEVMMFKGVPWGVERRGFIESVLRTFPAFAKVKGSAIDPIVTTMMNAISEIEFIPQAKLTELVYRYLKSQKSSALT